MADGNSDYADDPDPSRRFQWLLWRLLTAHPRDSIRIWTLEGVGCLLGWDFRGQLFALALPLSLPGVCPIEASPVELLKALQAAEARGDGVLHVEDSENLQSQVPEIDIASLAPVGVLSGHALQRMVEEWVDETSEEPDRTFVLVPTQHDENAAVVIIKPEEIRRLREYYPYVPEESITLAVDGEGRPALLGERVIVRFTAILADS